MGNNGVQNIADIVAAATVYGTRNDMAARVGIKQHRTVDADDIGIGHKNLGIFFDEIGITAGGNGKKTALGLKIPDGLGVFLCDFTAVVGNGAVDVGEDEITFEFVHVFVVRFSFVIGFGTSVWKIFCVSMFIILRICEHIKHFGGFFFKIRYKGQKSP